MHDILSRLSTLLAVALGALILTPSAPCQAQPSWPDATAMPQDFDWIRLPSDEWLKGDVTAMYDNELEFDSDELGVLMLDWKDIRELRSAEILQVRATGGRIGTGRVLMSGGALEILGTGMTLPQDQIISITAGEPKEINFWAIRVSAGATVREGNSDQRDFYARANSTRRTVDNRVRIDYLANYARTNDVETTNNHRANFSWDRFITDRFFLRPAFGEYFRDPFQNIAHRVWLGTGVGWQIQDTSVVSWDVFAGPAYQATRFDEVEPGEDDSVSSAALVVGTFYERELTDWIDFRYEYGFQFTASRSGGYNHHMVGALEIELTDSLDLDLSLIWDRIEEPQRDADGILPEQDDWRYVVGLGWEF
jgi:hypothetical protein